MDGYFIHVATELEDIRRGDGEEPSGWLKISELKTWSLWRAVLAEFIATLLFVFIGTMSAVAIVADDDAHANFVKIALTFGLMIAVCIQMIGHVSGGHMNPAVSIAMAAVRAISPIRACLYCVAQCVGGILGSLLLKGLTPSRLHDNLGVTGLNPEISSGQGFVGELVFTFILVTSIFGCTDSNRVLFGSPALGIGLTVSVVHLAAIPFTGASMNPARSLASAVISNSFDDHWVYWAGPILGGIAAALLYTLVLNPYRNALTHKEAANELLKSSDVIGIPKTYFSNAELITNTNGNTDGIKETQFSKF